MSSLEARFYQGTSGGYSIQMYTCGAAWGGAPATTVFGAVWGGRSTAARVSLVPAASVPAPAPPTKWAQLLPPPPGCPSPVVAGHANTRTHDHSHTRTPHRQDRRTHTTLVPLGARCTPGQPIVLSNTGALLGPLRPVRVLAARLPAFAKVVESIPSAGLPPLCKSHDTAIENRLVAGLRSAML